MRSLKQVILFLFYLNTAICFSQGSLKIDSLRASLKRHSFDSTGASINNSLAFEFIRINDDSVKKYLAAGKQIAVRKNVLHELSRNYSIAGNFDYTKGNSDSAVIHFTKALVLDISLGSSKGMIDDYMHLGKVFASKGNIDKALDQLSKGLTLAKKTGDKEQEADCLFRLAVIYDRQDEPKKAIMFCENAIILQKETKDSAGMAYSYHRMGLSYEGIKNYSQALRYLELSYDIRKKIGAKAQLGASLNGIGLVYMDQGDYQKALLKFYDAYKCWSEANDKEGIVIATGNLGELSVKMHDDDNALKYFLQSYKISDEIHALSFQKGTLRVLAEIYYRKGNYKTAYDYFNKFSELRDKLYSDENADRMARMQSQYESEQKEQKIQLLTKEKQLQASELGQKKIFVNALLAGGALLLLLAFTIFNRYRLKQKANHKLQTAFTEIEQKNDKLIEVYNVLEENRDVLATKNKEITDSIKYAKRLQEAILPTESYVNSILPDSFVLYKPKDIVSGDFYWFDKRNDSVLFAAVDCTGHGVPGAFMSIVGYNLLNQAVNEHGLSKPNLILNELNKGITQTLKQREDDSVVKDGMDIALCSINNEKTKLEYAGAYNSLWIIRGGAIMEFPADKHPIGVFIGQDIKQFTNKEIDLKQGDMIYIYTDGYADQFGGPKGKKFKYKQLQQLLLDHHQKPVKDQKQILDDVMEGWKASLEQVDDILLIGVRV